MKKQIFKIIYYSFFFLVLGIGVLLAISVLPVVKSFKIMTVISGSMEPAIKTGSIVIIAPEKEYKIGDVITFGVASKTSIPISHRIYDIKTVNGKTVYTTKGDANDAPDGKQVQNGDIIGKVVFHVPYIGYAINVAKKPMGFMTIIIVPAAIIISEEALNLKNEVFKPKKTQNNG